MKKIDPPDTDSVSALSPTSSNLSSHVHSGDRAMLSSIDNVIFENDAYWNERIMEELTEFESYRDVHPSILTDAARTVKVFVDSTGPYKGTAGLKRVALEDYISHLHKQDEKAVQLCRLLRDHIEVLEDTIKDSKVKIMKLHQNKLSRFIIFGETRFLKETLAVDSCYCQRWFTLTCIIDTCTS